MPGSPGPAPAQQLAEAAGAGRKGPRLQHASAGSSAASLKIDEKKPSVSEQLVTWSAAQREEGREGGMGRQRGGMCSPKAPGSPPNAAPHLGMLLIALASRPQGQLALGSCKGSEPELVTLL